MIAQRVPLYKNYQEYLRGETSQQSQNKTFANPNLSKSKSTQTDDQFLDRYYNERLIKELRQRELLLDRGAVNTQYGSSHGNTHKTLLLQYDRYAEISQKSSLRKIDMKKNINSQVANQVQQKFDALYQVQEDQRRKFIHMTDGSAHTKFSTQKNFQATTLRDPRKPKTSIESHYQNIDIPDILDYRQQISRFNQDQINYMPNNLGSQYMMDEINRNRQNTQPLTQHKRVYENTPVKLQIDTTSPEKQTSIKDNLVCHRQNTKPDQQMLEREERKSQHNQEMDFRKNFSDMKNLRKLSSQDQRFVVPLVSKKKLSEMNIDMGQNKMTSQQKGKIIIPSKKYVDSSYTSDMSSVDLQQKIIAEVNIPKVALKTMDETHQFKFPPSPEASFDKKPQRLLKESLNDVSLINKYQNMNRLNAVNSSN